MKSLRTILVLSSLLQLFLFYQLITYPADIITGFGLVSNDVAEMIARRASMLFLGVGMIGIVTAFWADRAILSISFAMSISWIGMAGESFYEWNRSFAGDGIQIPMILEAFFGLVLLGLVIYEATRKSLKP